MHHLNGDTVGIYPQTQVRTSFYCIIMTKSINDVAGSSNVLLSSFHFKSRVTNMLPGL